MADRTKLEQLLESDPKAAFDLLRKIQKTTVIPHEGGQREIVDDTHRFKIVCCGRRFGKTTVAAKKAVERCREKEDQVVWWVAPTYKIVRRGYREVLRQLPRELIIGEPPQDSAFDAGRSVKLRFKNGSIMEFYSAERPEGMLGEGVDYVVIDEAAIISKGVWDQTIRPTLMDRKGEALMISTPRGRNWFYYQWLRGQKDEFPEYASWRFPSSSNPYLPPEEIENMRQELPLLEFQQEVEADFVASAGSVFRFNPEIIVDSVQPKGQVIVGIDLAKSNDFTVFTAYNADTGEPCGYQRFNEVAWKIQRNRIKSFTAQLIKAGATGVTLVIDSTGVGDPIAEEIEEEGFDVIPINFTKTKQFMVTQLSKDLEDGTARLNKLEDRTEFENYTYSITEAGRWTYSAPEGQHDDCVSARMLAQWGLTQEGVPNAIAIGMDEPFTEFKPIKAKPWIEDDQDPEDYSDLIDEKHKEIEVSERPLRDEDALPDNPMAIMQRSDAWNAWG